jgi:hypothetical protein
MVESQHHHTPHHSIWANYNNSHTWNKAILGWFPFLSMIPVRENSEVLIFHPDILYILKSHENPWKHPFLRDCSPSDTPWRPWPRQMSIEVQRHGRLWVKSPVAFI